VNFACLAILAATAQAAPPTVNHDYDLKNVLWNLRVDPDAHTLQGDDTNTVTLNEDTPTLQFHSRNLQISQVTVNGQAAQFNTDNDILTVTLPNPGHKGDTLDVRSIYTAAPKTGFYFVDPAHAFPAKTGMVYTQGEGEDNRNWLPTYDLPDDKSTAECFVDVPGSWNAISNGKFMGAEAKGDRKVFHWKMDQPFSTYLISLVAGPYVEGKGSWHGIPVSYWVPPGLADEGKLSFGNTPKMIDLYSHLTGVDYPYAKFSQETVGDFTVGGMENITAVTQMIRTLHLANTDPINDSTYLVAHELAHQWFGDLVTCRTWEHMWLNEGFATFMPTMLDRNWHGQDLFDLDRYNNFEGAIDSIGSRNRKDVPGEIGSVPTVNMGSPYPGGASRIVMLMHKLGEQPFWKAINTYLETYKFQPATTDDFFQVVGKSSGQDLGDFERQWYHTAATPSLRVSVEGQDLIVKQLAPYYHFDLPVWFLDKGGFVKQTIHVDGPESRLRVPNLVLDPVLLDPECWTVMELAYDVDNDADSVARLYGAAPNVAGKARIIAELFSRLPVQKRIEIAKAERFNNLVGMIAQGLGKPGEDYLVSLTHRGDVRLANTAVEALGKFAQIDATRVRLDEIATTSPNEAVREHALRSLLAQSDDPKLADRAWATHAFDDGFRVMAIEWWAKHDPEKARAVSLQVLGGTEDDPVRIAACQALGTVKGDQKVCDALIKVATENSYRARLSAIRALGSLGNPAAIPVLEGFTKYEPGAVLGTAGASLKQLRG
jgi:aminopeptidase N